MNFIKTTFDVAFKRIDVPDEYVIHAWALIVSTVSLMVSLVVFTATFLK